MLPSSRYGWLVFLLLGGLCQLSWAQNPPFETGIPSQPFDPSRPSISGLVLHAETGKPAEGVVVILETRGGAVVERAWTKSGGRFEFFRIPLGEYVLAVNQLGYKPVRATLEFTVAPMIGVNIYLTPEEEEGSATPPEGAISLRRLQVPPQAEKELEKGKKALAAKQAQKAIAHFRKAIVLYPNNDEAYVQLGLVLLDEGAYSEAEEAARSGIRVNNQNAPAHAVLGVALRFQNRGRESREVLERAVELQENSWFAHLELGHTLAKLQDYEAAYRHVSRAHELHAQSASVHLTLYNLLVRRGEMEKALLELEEFLRLFPNHRIAARAKEMHAKLAKRVATNQP